MTAIDDLPFADGEERLAFAAFAADSPFHPSRCPCPPADVDWMRVYLLWRLLRRTGSRTDDGERGFGYLLRAFARTPSGDDLACRELVRRWQAGDLAGSVPGLLELSRRGQPEALFYAGHFHDAGRGVPVDPGESLRCLEKACTGGFTQALFQLAVVRLELAKTPGETDLAREDFALALLAPDPSNFCGIGTALLLGLFGDPDPDRAELYLRRAAALHDPAACCRLACGMEDGLFADTGDATRLLADAAGRDHPAAQFLLGQRYLQAAIEGRALEDTSGEAVAPIQLFGAAATLLRDAAGHGFPAAVALFRERKAYTLADGSSVQLPDLAGR